MFKRAISGIKPTGTPHLGNWFGMIQPAVALQETHDLFLFVADFHALTTSRDRAALKASTREVAATLLAAGLDPHKSTLFKQSDVPEVCELAWHLSCVTGLGLMKRSHAYKAAEQKGEEISFGTFSYPALMAADIVLYDADVVPVGKDQVQHIEMTQDMVTRFNTEYGPRLKRPEQLVRENVQTITGTDGRKMSKSYGNTIEVFLPPKKLKKAIMGIVTDSAGVSDPKDPEKCNVFNLYRAVASESGVEEMTRRYREGGFGYGEAKLCLFETLDRTLEPVRERYLNLMSPTSELDDVLREGGVKAKEASRFVLQRVRMGVGLR
jgi:tryptophanyl-tRNA synthetase